jgi:imidazolonepropionase-like amidohydrolase
MGISENRYLFADVKVFDGVGPDLQRADVLVEGERIAAVRPPGTIGREGIDVIRAEGMTLVPGLIEAHSHLTFSSAFDRIMPVLAPPTEQHVLCAAHNAKTLLDFGFTAAYSGGSIRPLIEVAVRDDINNGYIPGPRLKASSQERNVDGGRIDTNDVNAVLAWANEMIGHGVDSLKIVINGRGAMEPEFWQRINYGETELAALSNLARDKNVMLSAHAMTAQAIKLAVKSGVRAIYHCNFADNEALDLLEEAKDRVFVAPAVGILVADAYERFATREEAEKIGAFEALEGQIRVIPEMRKRGIRVLPGGDYGFAWNPIGHNARDLEHFVKLFGYEPHEVLRAATSYGAALFGMPDALGQVREGYLADLLLLDGDPLADITLLQKRDRILAVMKNGRFHRREGRAGVNQGRIGTGHSLMPA